MVDAVMSRVFTSAILVEILWATFFRLFFSGGALVTPRRKIRVTGPRFVSTQLP